MILMLLLWIALWRWRSWEFLGYFALTLAILQGGLGFLANLSTPELAGLPWYVVLLATLIDAAIYVGIFQRSEPR